MSRKIKLAVVVLSLALLGMFSGAQVSQAASNNHCHHSDSDSRGNDRGQRDSYISGCPGNRIPIPAPTVTVTVSPSPVVVPTEPPCSPPSPVTVANVAQLSNCININLNTQHYVLIAGGQNWTDIAIQYQLTYQILRMLNGSLQSLHEGEYVTVASLI
jgi:hypothetical protein